MNGGFSSFILWAILVSRLVGGETMQPVRLSLNCQYKTTPPHSSYPDPGNRKLTNGKSAKSFNWWDEPAWVGYLGNFEVVIDLGTVKKITCLKTDFMQNSDGGIFLPKTVIYETSLDNVHFTSVSKVNCPKSSLTEFRLSYGFEVKDIQIMARFVKVKVINPLKKIKEEMGSAPAWLFIDEIEIYGY